MAGQRIVAVLDECLSFRLARMLAGYHENHPQLAFKAMQDLHRRGTLDREWLQRFPDHPPHVVITKDDALLRETGQLRAWIKGGLTVVIFGPEFANQKREEMAIAIFRWLPTILRTVDMHPRGRAFGVPSAFRRLDVLPDYIPPAHRRRPRRPKASTTRATATRQRQAAAAAPAGQLTLPLAPAIVVPRATSDESPAAPRGVADAAPNPTHPSADER
ncbi:MAG: hypothetical protein IT429_13540 [Gemmataceae bacterium]|nr:hypothetical protein [Gemmataceae bacterium]